jgi:hypothetical protein
MFQHYLKTALFLWNVSTVRSRIYCRSYFGREIHDVHMKSRRTVAVSYRGHITCQRLQYGLIL